MAFSGARLASGRLAAGLTQQRLAQLMHTSQRRISDWERGMIAPRPELIPMLAAALGLDALEFLTPGNVVPTLEDMRLAAGLTMDEVASRLSITRSRYRALEVGARRRDPSSDLVEKLAAVFAVPASTVLAALDAARP